MAETLNATESALFWAVFFILSASILVIFRYLSPYYKFILTLLSSIILFLIYLVADVAFEPAISKLQNYLKPTLEPISEQIEEVIGNTVSDKDEPGWMKDPCRSQPPANAFEGQNEPVGYIYVGYLINHTPPVVKIGCTKRHPKERIREYSGKHNIQIQLFQYEEVPYSNLSFVERKVHARFRQFYKGSAKELFYGRPQEAIDIVRDVAVWTKLNPEHRTAIPQSDGDNRKSRKP